MKNNSFKKIYECVKQAKSILISSHLKPDGDAIGSLLALNIIIERLNIPVDIVVPDISEVFKTLPDSKKILTEVNKDYDLTILVDVSSKSQLGRLGYLYEKSKKLIIFDHHEVDTKNKCIHYIDPLMASTTMIMYYFAKANNIEIDLKLATYLYIGLLTDTGGFAHQNTTSKVFDVASCLLKTGINHSKLYIKFVKKEYSLDYLLLEKNVIENLEIINGNITFSFLNNEIIKKYPYDSPKEFVNLGKYMKNIEVSIMIIEEEPNLYRVSLRSRDYVDVSKIAKKFNGGGHKHASGIRFVGDYDINKKSILDEVIKLI